MHRSILRLWIVALTLLPGSLIFAQDEKPATEKPATEKPAAEKPTEEKPAETPAEPEKEQTEWDKLSARKLEIAKTLQKLGKEFQSASVERKLEIRASYEELIQEFQAEILPAMTELAEPEFEKNPKNTDAAEILARDAYFQSDFETVQDLGEKLGQLDVPVDGTYSKLAIEYVAQWNEEQEIRKAEAALEGDEKLPVAELETSKGKIVLQLFENQAPNTVANFVSLIESGFYDGIKFHRVEPNFVIQGGDPNSKDDDPENDGLGGPGYTIACECFEEDARLHFTGSLSMAHAGKDTGGSQFFITLRPTPNLNPNSGNQSNHTVFGRVIEGFDVVQKIEKDDTIEKATVVSKRDHEYKPETTPRPEAESAPSK